MATSLIRFDEKHISTTQVVMANDCVLEGIIHNLATLPITEIHGYLQEARFLHTSRMLRGCKLNPTLISALVARWRSETHTFHLPYSDCIITLEDLELQLSLLVDGSVVTGSVIVPSKKEALLGKVPNSFEGGQVRMKWWETNFKKLPPHATDVVATTPCELQRMRKTELGISSVGYVVPGVVSLVGLVATTVSMSLVSDPYMFSLVTRLNHELSYAGQLDQLKDIRLLLNQPSEVERMWDAKVSFIVYATIEMHESDQVDLWGKNEEDWKEIHKDYIDAWDCRMEFLPI
ncbi:hypothetical protein Goari_006247, partial [Gossypium aridum]|nr:hypothetical protein [Gossypium aridum]